MKAHPLKTHLIQPHESMVQILDGYLPPLKEGTILAVTSKIISLCQGRVVEKKGVAKKYDLITQEADAYLKEEDSCYDAHLTLKDNILIPSAGIDESNGGEVYILYPENTQRTARDIWQHLRETHHLTHLGVIITDSHTTPLRRGVTGIALGWCGFEPLYSYIGKPDIFNKPLQVTQINVLDALATAATFVMGEGDEQTPLALIEEAPKITFVSRPPTKEEEESIHIPLEDDIYAPLLRKGAWIWQKKDTAPH